MEQMMYYQVRTDGFQPMIDELLLLCGNDIPFEPAQLVIHQPRLKEIGYITEDKFWIGCELLKFDKEKLSDKDKLGLLN